MDQQVEPTTADEARHAIEETRGRISATLDAIEDRIQVKKEELKDKADVLRPVKDRIRSNPWQSLGVALGAGLVLGFATGGSSDSKSEKHSLDEEDRDDLRKWREQRKKRMRRLARRNDAGMHTKSSKHSHSNGNSLRDTLVSALSSAVTDGLKERARRMSEVAS